MYVIFLVQNLLIVIRWTWGVKGDYQQMLTNKLKNLVSYIMDTIIFIIAKPRNNDDTDITQSHIFQSIQNVHHHLCQKFRTWKNIYLAYNSTDILHVTRMETSTMMVFACEKKTWLCNKWNLIVALITSLVNYLISSPKICDERTDGRTNVQSDSCSVVNYLDQIV